MKKHVVCKFAFKGKKYPITWEKVFSQEHIDAEVKFKKNPTMINMLNAWSILIGVEVDELMNARVSELEKVTRAIAQAKANIVIQRVK